MIVQTENLTQLLKSKSKKLLLIDYDGALVSSHTRPEKAVLNEKVSQKLAALSARKDLKVIIMTGRSRTSIDSMIGHLPLDIIAEHGAFYKKKGVWNSLIEDDRSWKSKIFPTLVEYTLKCSGAFVEEKEYSLCWHYRECNKKDGKHFSSRLAEDLDLYVKKFNLQVLKGKKVLEFLPAPVNKGHAAMMLMHESRFDHIFTISDDLTDEGMCKALYPVEQCHTIKVGDGVTTAKHQLTNEKQVWQLLEKL